MGLPTLTPVHAYTLYTHVNIHSLTETHMHVHIHTKHPHTYSHTLKMAEAMGCH